MDKMKSENFGKNLERIMNALDLNQTELASRAGLTRAAVSQIINGQREPALSTVCKILSVIPLKFERLVE